MYMLEGEWSGYTSGQRRVVHREYLKLTGNRAFIPWLQKTCAIYFTDGTALQLSIREVDRKKETLINGYSSLIRDCFYENVNSVAALCKVQEKRKAALAQTEGE